MYLMRMAIIGNNEISANILAYEDVFRWSITFKHFLEKVSPFVVYCFVLPFINPHFLQIFSGSNIFIIMKKIKIVISMHEFL